MENQNPVRLVFFFEPREIAEALLHSTPDGTLCRATHGIPTDARFVRMYVNQSSQVLGIVYEHPSFSDRCYDLTGCPEADDQMMPAVGRRSRRVSFTGPNVDAILAEMLEVPLYQDASKIVGKE